MAHVAVRVGDNLIESVITKRSADEMHLKVGDTVSAIIKSTEVMTSDFKVCRLAAQKEKRAVPVRTARSNSLWLAQSF